MKQTKFTEKEVDAAYDKGVQYGKELAQKAIKAAYDKGISDALEVVQHAREEGEKDMRQVAHWIRAKAIEAKKELDE